MQEKLQNTPADILAVIGLMLAGILLRLFGLHAESAWWDEYASLAFLDAPTLAEFLQQNRTLDPATLPLYFVLEYCWGHTVSASLVSLRLLGIAIGIASIPLVYALGARLFGRYAGLAAALLLALSPIHIHHSQSVRMYGLLVLLGVASMWSLMRMLQQGRRSGWWLHGLLSMLLYWTHPFALLVPVAQGCWLLLHRRMYRRVLPGWFLMHAMLSLPVVVYVLSIKFWPQDTTAAWLHKPGVGALLADLFFDDIIAFHWQLRLGDIGVKMGMLRWAGDAVFALVILGCLIGWMVMLLHRREPGMRTNLSLLFCWLIVPPLALFIVSQIWRPCMFPRYTAHGAVAMYLLLGGMVQQMRHREWRLCAYAMLSGLMLFQWIVTLPGPQRTDWQSAAKYIATHAKHQDMVLVNDLLWRDVFLYNAKHVADVDIKAPVAAAADLSLLAAQSILFYGVNGKDTSGDAWAIIAADYFETAPPLAYEDVLEEWKITFERVCFPAIRNVYVYRLSTAGTLPQPGTLQEMQVWRGQTGGPGFAGYLKHDEMQAYAELAMAFAAQERLETALVLMKELFRISPFAAKVYGSLAQTMQENRDASGPADAVQALWDGYGYRENDRHELACQAFSKAAILDPANAAAALELGMELAELGQYEAAATALERAASLDDENAELVDNFVAAVRNGKDAANAFASVTLCRDALIALGEKDMDKAELLFKQALQMDPLLPRAQVMLGFMRALQERYDEAFDLFSAYLAHGKYHAPVAYSHLTLIHLLRDEPEKALVYAQQAMSLDPEFKKNMGPLVQMLLVEKDYTSALQEAERLRDNGVPVPPKFVEYLQKRVDH